MAFSIEGRAYIATYAIWSDPADDERHRAWVVDHTTRLAALGKGVYLGDTDFTRRADRFLSDANFGAWRGSGPAGDPDGRFCSYLIADGAELNAGARGDCGHAGPGRRRCTASGR